MKKHSSCFYDLTNHLPEDLQPCLYLKVQLTTKNLGDSWEREQNEVFDLNIVLQCLSYELVAVSTIVAEVVGFCSAFVSHIEKGQHSVIYPSCTFVC